MTTDTLSFLIASTSGTGPGLGELLAAIVVGAMGAVIVGLVARRLAELDREMVADLDRLRADNDQAERELEHTLRRIADLEALARRQAATARTRTPDGLWTTGPTGSGSTRG